MTDKPTKWGHGIESPAEDDRESILARDWRQLQQPVFVKPSFMGLARVSTWRSDDLSQPPTYRVEILTGGYEWTSETGFGSLQDAQKRADELLIELNTEN